MDGDLLTTAKTIGASVIAIAIVVAVISPVVGLALDVTEPRTYTVEPTTGQYVEFAGRAGTQEVIDVKATRENALQFDGTDAVESSAPQNLTNQSWTVCQNAQLGSDTTLNNTYDLFAYDNANLTIQYDAQHWSVYYNNSTHSAKATLPAPSPRNDFTPVCGRYNASSNELTVSRGTTISSPVALTTGITARNNSDAWIGKIDEVRAFGTPVTNQTLTAYANDPIQPLPGRDRLARFMFDEGTGTSTHVWFANSDATLQGASWTTGLPRPGISAGVDYVTQTQPMAIKALSGGYLDGAPVVYPIVGGHFAAVLYALQNTGGAALGLLVVGLLVLAGHRIMDTFGGGGGSF